MIHEIARAYHCPQGVIAYIARYHHDWLQALDDLGPMRVYWNPEHGWLLDHRPINIAHLENVHAD